VYLTTTPLVTWLFTITCALSFASCSKADEGEKKRAASPPKKAAPTTPVARTDAGSVKRLAAGLNHFTLDLHRALSKETDAKAGPAGPKQGAKRNMFHSPFNVATALAMTYGGAR
jgi:serine protease inhibitor